MKGKAIELVTPIRLCLIIGICILFSCKNEEGCDTSIVPNWSLAVACEVSQGDTLYIIDTEVFPLCRFNKYKVSLQDEWVDIESTIRLTANEIRLNGPDFRCSIEMKDKSIQSNMMDFNYLLQLNDGNCKLSSEAPLANDIDNETSTNQTSYVAPKTRKTEKVQQEKSTISYKETTTSETNYVAPLEQKIELEKPIKNSYIETPSTKPKAQEVSSISSSTNVPTYAPSKPVEVPAQTYTKPKTTDRNSEGSNSSYTKPQETKSEYVASTNKASVIGSTNNTFQKEPITTTKPTVASPTASSSSTVQVATSPSPTPPAISKTNTQSTSVNTAQKNQEVQKSQIVDNTSASIDEPETSTKAIKKAMNVSAAKKKLADNVEKETAKASVSKELSSKFSPTKFPTIQLHGECESSSYESGPLSFTIVPKVRMRLNKLTLYSDTESSINISISGGYNGILKNRVLLPTGKSEVGMSGFSTFLEPGKSYTLNISSSNSEQLSLKNISLCAKDAQDGPYFNISGSALKIISELKIDIE